VLDPNLLDELAEERKGREAADHASEQRSTPADATALQNGNERLEAAEKIFAYLSGTQKSDEEIIRLGLHKNNLVREGGLEPPRPKAADPKAYTGDAPSTALTPTGMRWRLERAATCEGQAAALDPGRAGAERSVGDITVLDIDGA
jgi:hypothetical protein